MWGRLAILRVQWKSLQQLQDWFDKNNNKPTEMSVTYLYLRSEESIFSSQTFVGHQKCCTLTAVNSISNINRTGITSLTLFQGTLLQTVHYITSNVGLFTFWSELAMHSLCLRMEWISDQHINSIWATLYKYLLR